MKTAEIAKALGVTTNTIRNWTKLYGEHLSAGAQPAAGQERSYNQRDLAVLRYVQGCVKQGMQHTEIALRLTETTISEAETAEAAPGPAQAQETAPEASLLPLQVVQASIERFDSLQATLQRQAERLEAIEGQQSRLREQRFNTWVLVAGIAIGVVLTVAAIWLALLIVRPAG